MYNNYKTYKNNIKPINQTIKNKSYSPNINKIFSSARNSSSFSKNNNSINLCENNKILLNNKCYNYNNNILIKLLKKKLNKKIYHPEKIILPKQIHSNCWFNTMFTVFFISDKGRKFFKFFRYLMITGKKNNNIDIQNKNLKILFFKLNLYIEESFNQSNNYTKKKNFMNIISQNLETNYFIKEIYKLINNNYNTSIPNIKEPGNPIEYYTKIMNYLDYNPLKITNINISNNKNIKKYLHNINIYNLPELLIIHDNESNTKYYKNIKIHNKNYILDSIIITNKGYFIKNENKHFVSLLTINNTYYKYDGDSIKKLSKFNWMKLLNRDKDWNFLENVNYVPEKYNMTKGYKMLFYYRIN